MKLYCILYNTKPSVLHHFIMTVYLISNRTFYIPSYLAAPHTLSANRICMFLLFMYIIFKPPVYNSYIFVSFVGLFGTNILTATDNQSNKVDAETTRTML